MARVGLAIGGVALVGVGAVLALGWWTPSDAEATDSVSEGFTKIEIANDSGNVTIRSGDGAADGPATVKQTFSYRMGSQPDSAFAVDGDTLRLDDCGFWCSVDYEVTVPRGVEVGGKASSGDVTLDGVTSVDLDVSSGNTAISRASGPVQVDASSGDVRVVDVAQDVKVSASSGSVIGERLGGKVDVDANSGDIRLAMAERADVRANADSGSIDLTVPRGQYKVDGQTDSGTRDVQVETSDSADTSLTVETSSGDALVRAA